MKRLAFLSVLLICFLSVLSVSSQNETGTLILVQKDVELPVSGMFWNESGKVLTLVSPDAVIYIPTADEFAPKDMPKDLNGAAYVDADGRGKAAALSADQKTITVYGVGSGAKDVLTIDPGFTALSVSLSEDGSLITADSADEIRTVVFDSSSGKKVYDLEGFQTAAPVYDSTLSRDGKNLIWHARGTFALQNVSDGKFGETVSLWDFASSYDLSPNNRILAVGIIDEDYENSVVIFFDTRSGEELGRTVLDNVPYELSFSADGSFLFAADSGTIYKIRMKDFEVVQQTSLIASGASEKDRISRIASSPDGDLAAVLLSTGDLVLVD